MEETSQIWYWLLPLIYIIISIILTMATYIGIRLHYNSTHRSHWDLSIDAQYTLFGIFFVWPICILAIILSIPFYLLKLLCDYIIETIEVHQIVKRELERRNMNGQNKIT